MFTKRLLAVAVAGVALSLGIAGGASAMPSLTIIDGAGFARTAPSGGNCAIGDPGHCEVIGDAGGTSYPWAGGPGRGAGLPNQGGGWPNTPNFAVDPSFPAGGGALGMSGWHGSYLRLEAAADVTFQFMGAGDSGQTNSFWLNSDNPNTPVVDVGWWQMFADGESSNPTNPIRVGGNPPVYGPPIGGGFPTQNQYTIALPGGLLIPFAFDIAGVFDPASPDSVVNDGVRNPSGVLADRPGFFLGCDPYLASGKWPSSCNVAFVGLTDLPNPSDHDFQDMGVRITVETPEPGTLALLGIALSGLAVARKRRSAKA